MYEKGLTSVEDTAHLCEKEEIVVFVNLIDPAVRGFQNVRAVGRRIADNSTRLHTSTVPQSGEAPLRDNVVPRLVCNMEKDFHHFAVSAERLNARRNKQVHARPLNVSVTFRETIRTQACIDTKYAMCLSVPLGKAVIDLELVSDETDLLQHACASRSVPNSALLLWYASSTAGIGNRWRQCPSTGNAYTRTMQSFVKAFVIGGMSLSQAASQISACGQRSPARFHLQLRPGIVAQPTLEQVRRDMK